MPDNPLFAMYPEPNGSSKEVMPVPSMKVISPASIRFDLSSVYSA